MKTIEQLIKENVNAITQTPAYKSWFTELKISEDDIIQLNNSFIFRDVSTKKSDKYLGFSVSSSGKVKDFVVIEGIGGNSDFKHISSKSSNFSKTRLADAIKQEKRDLRTLLYMEIMDKESR